MTIRPDVANYLFIHATSGSNPRSVSLSQSTFGIKPLYSGFYGKIATGHRYIEHNDVYIQGLTMFVALILWYGVV
jgi:hypothetical protein